jgi:ABC-type bacteriocin/lantibiotic exporter with double-glycine peptidase domain
MLVHMCGDMLSNVGAAEKVFRYLDRKPNMPQPGTLAPPTLQGLVEFRDVSFAYPNNSDQPVLKVHKRGHKEGTWTSCSLLLIGGQKPPPAYDLLLRSCSYLC